MADKVENKKSFDFKKIILIIITILFLIVSTSIIAYLVAKKVTQPETNKENEKLQERYIYSGGEYLTNLADKGYIKLTLEFELENKEILKELDKRNAEIRNRIISVLRSNTSEDVKGDRGMEKLRAAIQNELNLTLKQGQVTDVYFTSIIVH